ncbi:hypothetical protein BZM27_49310 [Paraburkholderia steynii]|uniref:Uncharacterized protein n=1 Tax=Paraburkholderia steynii TaxID=1245441 RepID=A0A4R0X797_9BURK|nr:hypothetical protein BZM27_49310 [Paraburkholderia steynii]
MLFRRPALWRLRGARRGKNDSLRLLTGTLKLSGFVAPTHRLRSPAGINGIFCGVFRRRRILERIENAVYHIFDGRLVHDFHDWRSVAGVAGAPRPSPRLGDAKRAAFIEGNA